MSDEIDRIVGQVRANLMGTEADAAAIVKGIKDAADAIRRWEEAEKLRQAVTVEMLRTMVTMAPFDERAVKTSLAEDACAKMLVGMNVLALSIGERLFVLTDFGKMLADAIGDDTWRAAMRRIGSHDKAETAFVEACSYALTMWVEHQWERNMLEGGK